MLWFVYKMSSMGSGIGGLGSQPVALFGESVRMWCLAGGRGTRQPDSADYTEESGTEESPACRAALEDRDSTILTWQ